MSTTSLIPLTQLDKSDLNVRTSFDKVAMHELQASILAHGLMQNLVVTKSKGNRYGVIAGGRRLAAMQALQKEGKLPKDHTVACRIADDEKASELSLAENTVREEMHPADEFDAFAALSKEHNPADIARRFGVTEKHVHQRMRLARVAPELMKAYRAGDLSLDAMMAFTLSDDHNHQRKVYKATGKNPQGHYVRRLMTEKSESSKGKLCKFVTLKAYVDAGGKIRADLFGSETFLENPELLHRLAKDKLAAIAEKLKAEGWGWVETALENDYMFISRYGRIHPKPTDAPKKLTDKLKKLQADYDKVDDACAEADHEDDEMEAKRDELQAQLDELEAELQEYNKFDSQQMKSAGAYVRPDYDGKIEITRGLVSKAEEEKLNRADGKRSAEPQEKGLSQSLLLSLQAFRLQVSQVALASKPDLAYDLLVFKACHSLISEDFGTDGLDIKFFNKTPSMGQVKDTPTEKALAGIKAKLPLKWLDADDESERFDAFRKLPSSQKAALLAYCVALTLEPALAPEADTEISAYDSTLALTGVELSDYWRPTADNYLSKITRDRLIALGSEIFGKTWGPKWATARKGDQVKELASAFADPKRYAANKDVEKKLRTWLPEGMAFTLPENKPTKAKEAATC